MPKIVSPFPAPVDARPNFVSLFTGAGGIDMAFEMAGFRCVYQCEIDMDCQGVLCRHFPTVRRGIDIRNVNPLHIPSSAVWAFGSPCQNFSIAGNREGIAGKSSQLFYEAIRLIQWQREQYGSPELVLFENVPGVLSSQGGKDFQAILDAFQKCGACDICWRVLDAQCFGVPQRRRRLYLIADFRAERAEKILFEREVRTRDTAPSRKTRQADTKSTGQSFADSGLRPTPIGISESIGFALRASPSASGDKGDGGMNTTVVIEQMGVRRLMPIEAERLQGWPDNYTLLDERGKEIPDTARYRMIGNGVALPVVYWIAKRLKDLLYIS